LDTLAPLRLNGPYFVPRGLPAFALLAILLFHSRANQRIRNRALTASAAVRFRTG
jgi:hypothetical protein